MKNTYSNFDDPIIANQRLRSKLDFLQRQSLKRQSYLKDLQTIVKQNQQTIEHLLQNNTNKTISTLTEQNIFLTCQLKQQYSTICKMNVLYLMQCQLRVEQKKSYNQRINQFQNNIAQLRKYLHDKEDTFTHVIDKLKKYQELGIEFLGKRLENYSAVFLEDTVKNVIKQISEEKQMYKQKYSELYKKYQHNQHNQQIRKGNNKVQSNQSIPIREQSLIYKRNQTNLSTNITSGLTMKMTSSSKQPQQISQQPNSQLIRLMKRQKLSNQILQQALTQAIQKNIQLIQCTKLLSNNNKQLRQQMDCIIAEMVILCDSIVNRNVNIFDKEYYKMKGKIIKSKCDSDQPNNIYKQIVKKYLHNDIQEAEIIVFNRMRNDVDEMGEYIAFCNIDKKNNIKSFQCPVKRSYNYQNQPISYEESLNQQQFSINQI